MRIHCFWLLGIVTRTGVVGVLATVLSGASIQVDSDVSPSSGRVQVKQSDSAIGLEDWHLMYRGRWKTLVSGAQDAISVASLRAVVEEMQKHSSPGFSSKDVGEWVGNFLKWEASAQDGVVQKASKYSQVERFVVDGVRYYQANEHGGGYSAALRNDDAQAPSGLVQIWRDGAWHVMRRTFVGTDDSFELFEDKASSQTVPFYVMLAEEGRLLRQFVLDEGISERDGMMVYTGDMPAIGLVTYPAWFRLGCNMIVLRDVVGSGRYSLSLRSHSGHVMQELEVVHGGAASPISLDKVVYLPYTNLKYLQTQVRRIEFSAEDCQLPPLNEIAEHPVRADFIVDCRANNLLVPIGAALKGDAGIVSWAEQAGLRPAPAGTGRAVPDGLGVDVDRPGPLARRQTAGAAESYVGDIWWIAAVFASFVLLMAVVWLKWYRRL